MNITNVCVKRPVFTTMLMVSLIVLGLASFVGLGVDLYPKVDIPVVTATTILEGASPEEIESEVTKPLEEELNTISGVDYMRSVSTEGKSIIIASFVLEKDLDVAVNDVNRKISASLYKLPKGIESPVIAKVDPDAMPIASVLLSSNRNPKETTELADKVVKRRLQTVKDVGSITLLGGTAREIQIIIDPKKLFSYNLSINEVKNNIQNQNLEIPAGRLTWELSERGLRTLGRVDSVEKLSNIIIADYKGAPVRIKDIGEVIDGVEEARSISKVNGKEGIALQIRKQSGSNTIEVVDKINERIEEIQESLPADVKLSLVRDQSRFIRKSIAEVEHHLILGAIFVSLVILFFMRDFKAAVVASIAIPVSIIGTFLLMKIMGFTLNNMTLLALSMCTGIVIDDAIIVLENIFRYVEEKGISPMEAAVEATNEILSAVVATTTSLVVIFLPVGFMSGTVGKFFNSFGLTAAFAITLSLFVALTLIPTLTGRLFKSSNKFNTKQKTSKDTLFFRVIDHLYDKALRWSLDHRLIIVIIAISIVCSTPLIFKLVKFEFFPEDDMSEYAVVLETPPGSSLTETANVTKQIEDKIRKLDGVNEVFTTIGDGSSVTGVSIYINLLPMKERNTTQDELMKQTREIIKDYPGLRPSVQFVSTVADGASRRTKYNMVIQGPDIKKLEEYSKEFIRQLSHVKGFVDLDTAVPDVSPEVQIDINRDRASDLGINIMSIASAMKTMVGGEKISTFKEGSEQYDIRLRLNKENRKSIEDVNALPIRTANQDLIRLDNIAEVKEGKSPSQINHYNMEREITVIANLDGLALGDAVKAGEKILKNMNLPSEYKTYPIGLSKMLEESVHNFLIATVLSIIFIYIVLAAQFESYTQPLIIMSSIPLAVPFGLLSLWAFDQTLNIYSMIGMLVLFGVVKKNAILQVDYTNTLVAQGKAIKDAIIEADHERLRPILMTTVTIIAGMLPLALGKGDGSGARGTMATLIMGGQALCLVITLLVVPVLYSLRADGKLLLDKYFNNFKGFLQAKFQKNN